jgi:hypothetical protein
MLILPCQQRDKTITFGFIYYIGAHLSQQGGASGAARQNFREGKYNFQP